MKGGKAVSELEALGFIRGHELVRKGSGGRFIVLEILERGIIHLKKLGISVTEKLLKRGGFKHDQYARWIVNWASSQGFRYTVEHTLLGVKAFDVTYVDRDGRLIGVEICLTGSPQYNTEAGIKAASVPGISSVRMGFEDKKLMSSVSKNLMSAHSDFKNKFEIFWLGEFCPYV
jgi:hypothetical protein